MPNSQCSILLVESDQDLREILTRAFLRRGFRVTAVAHSRQALEAVTVSGFNVAVLDEAPTDQSFRSLMHKLKGQAAGLEVILLAAYWDDASEAEAMKEGAFACLGKPCSLNVLVEAISDAFGKFEHAVKSTTLGC